MAKEKKVLIDWAEHDYVAGLDEVGRGCGAGPVVTADHISALKEYGANRYHRKLYIRNIIK